MAAPLLAKQGDGDRLPPKNISPEIIASNEDPLSAYLAYRYSTASGDSVNAAQLLARAIELDPSVTLMMESASFRALQGDYAKAQIIVEGILKTSPRSVAALSLLGKIYSAQGFNLRAIELYEEAIRLGSASDEIYGLLVQGYMSIGEIAKAKRVAESMLAKGESATTGVASFYLGILYDKYLHDPDRALKAYERVLSFQPRDTFVLDRIAQIYFSKGDPDAALSVYERLRQVSPADLNTLFRLALIYYEKRDFKKVEELLQSILKETPESDRARYFLGLIQMEAGNYPAARRDLSRVPKTSSYHEDARVQTVLSYIKQKDLRRAQAKVEKAIRDFPSEFRFRELLAAILEQKGDLKGMLHVFESIEAQFDKEWRYHYARAMSLEKTGDWAQAISEMKKVLEIDPNQTMALNYIGYTYAERNLNLKEALLLLERAYALDPKNGYIIDSLGWVHVRLNRLKTAKILLEQAKTLAPNEPTVIDHLGDLYVRLGEKARAEALFRKALDLLLAKPKSELSSEDRRTLNGLKQKLHIDEEGTEP